MFPGQCSVPVVYEFLLSNKRHAHTYTLKKKKGRKEREKERKKIRKAERNDETRSAI